MRKMVYAGDIKQVLLDIEKTEAGAGFEHNMKDAKIENYAKVKI